MSTVKVNITMSLDGFVAGPNQSEKDPLGIGGEQLHQWLLPLKAFRETHGEEGGEVNASERGGWQLQFFDEGAGTIAKEGLFVADALLLGRVTYEHFAAAWPGMTDEEGFAERMNSIPKFVASTTLTDAEWNATVIRDPAEDVPKLKEQHDLLVMGSGRLVQALRRNDLVDEYEIWIHPILLGAGPHLFEQTGEKTALALTGTKTTDKGVTVLTLRGRALTRRAAQGPRRSRAERKRE